jgi:hypothetical protein
MDETRVRVVSYVVNGHDVPLGRAYEYLELLREKVGYRTGDMFRFFRYEDGWYTTEIVDRVYVWRGTATLLVQAAGRAVGCTALFREGDRWPVEGFKATVDGREFSVLRAEDEAQYDVWADTCGGEFPDSYRLVLPDGEEIELGERASDADALVAALEALT